jgi:predicted phosphodiesterase
MSKKVIVVGDAHVDEFQELGRFKLLNALIRSTKPDYVVIIGDFLSLNCLSAWDRNKRLTMEGLRYFAEIEAGNTALDLMLDRIPKKTKVVYVEGNHEDRLPRYLETDPTFYGFAGIEKDLRLADRGIQYVPYKDVFYIDGVGFTHIPINGMGKGIGNPGVAQKALKLFHHSIVFGHTHTLDHAAEHRHGAPHLNQALSVGCFFEHVDEYAKGSKTDYWRGICVLDIYKENRFDVATYSLGRLETVFGEKSDETEA